MSGGGGGDGDPFWLISAILDLKLLTHFATTELPFMMEVCARTENDKKGGHLARRKADGRSAPDRERFGLSLCSCARLYRRFSFCSV